MKKKNSNIASLYRDALHMGGKVANNGALLAYSGEKTGRSPKDKRIVTGSSTENIWWGKVNMPISSDLFSYYRDKAAAYITSQPRHYQIDVLAGWDPNHQIKVRLCCLEPYHAIFIQNMLICPTETWDVPDFTIWNAGLCPLSAMTAIKPSEIESDPSLTDTLVAMDLDRMQMILYGTRYAGEMKKGILTLMMYLMPIKNLLPLHSSANIGPQGDTSMFFGLSGTGKTSLSADPERSLIGDDEHVWTSTGIFNIEGGCYAKCLGLSQEKEPEIYQAIHFGAIVENAVVNSEGYIDFEDDSLTQNTRCAYPLDFIKNVTLPALGGHPNHIIFLTCDAYGVLPPISKLTLSQAIYWFLSGYTSKTPGTEVGVTEPEATFSACFGEPFLVWSPNRYGRLLKQYLVEHSSQVWLINTGWTHGPYGEGYRVPIKLTRKMIHYIHRGHYQKDVFQEYGPFQLQIPTDQMGLLEIESDILQPHLGWKSISAYQDKVQYLFERFQENAIKKGLNLDSADDASQ